MPKWLLAFENERHALVLSFRSFKLKRIKQNTSYWKVNFTLQTLVRKARLRGIVQWIDAGLVHSQLGVDTCIDYGHPNTARSNSECRARITS